MNWHSLVDYDMMPDGELGVALWWAQNDYYTGLASENYFITCLNCIFDEMVKTPR